MKNLYTVCTSASGCQHISLKLCISPIRIKKREWKWKINGCKTKNRKRESLENPWKSNASFLAFHINQMRGRVRKYWAWTEKERGGGRLGWIRNSKNVVVVRTSAHCCWMGKLLVQVGRKRTGILGRNGQKVDLLADRGGESSQG